MSIPITEKRPFEKYNSYFMPSLIYTKQCELHDLIENGTSFDVFLEFIHNLKANKYDVSEFVFNHISDQYQEKHTIMFINEIRKISGNENYQFNYTVLQHTDYIPLQHIIRNGRADIVEYLMNGVDFYINKYYYSNSCSGMLHDIQCDENSTEYTIKNSCQIIRALYNSKNSYDITKRDILSNILIANSTCIEIRALKHHCRPIIDTLLQFVKDELTLFHMFYLHNITNDKYLEVLTDLYLTQIENYYAEKYITLNFVFNELQLHNMYKTTLFEFLFSHKLLNNEFIISLLLMIINSDVIGQHEQKMICDVFEVLINITKSPDYDFCVELNVLFEHINFKYILQHFDNQDLYARISKSLHYMCDYTGNLNFLSQNFEILSDILNSIDVSMFGKTDRDETNEDDEYIQSLHSSSKRMKICDSEHEHVSLLTSDGLKIINAYWENGELKRT